MHEDLIVAVRRGEVGARAQSRAIEAFTLHVLEAVEANGTCEAYVALLTQQLFCVEHVFIAKRSGARRPEREHVDGSRTRRRERAAGSSRGP